MVRHVGQTGLVDIILGDPGARMLQHSKQKVEVEVSKRATHFRAVSE